MKFLCFFSEGVGEDAGPACAEDRGFYASAGEHNSFPVQAGALRGERPVSQGLPGISGEGPQGVCFL